MAEKHLFGAEVNKIQETLFRASRQREVVGGSHLLAVFGEQAETIARKQYGAEDVIVRAGGNFRMVFADVEKARQFGEHLVNSYHLLLEGTMTVADPVPFSEGGFAAAKGELGRQLSQRKRSATGPVDLPHSPTIALCRSSGVGLAVTYASPVPPRQPEYAAAFVRRMGQVGFDTKRGATPFLDDINRFLSEEFQEWDWAPDPESVAAWDPDRGNVAYLVADGNNMGAFFDACETPKDWKHLSARLTEVTQRAIAAPIPALLQRLLAAKPDYAEKRRRSKPVLPLIAAGDDVFVLLPAPYALDYARQFCIAFEQGMQGDEVVQRMVAYGTPPPTMSAAVVICKDTYPYHLAHHHGETLLREAKRVVKVAGREGGQWLSAVAFDLLVGSELVEGQGASETEWRNLSTYWVVNEQRAELAALSPAVTRATIPLRQLLDQRLILRQMPSKRLAEVRALFDRAGDYDEAEWRRQWARLEQRLRVSAPQEALHLTLGHALSELGDRNADPEVNPARWLRVWRSGQEFWGHGFPDLLRVWDYAQRLDVDPGEYAGRREL